MAAGERPTLQESGRMGHNVGTCACMSCSMARQPYQQINADLLGSCKELVAALSAAMRVVADLDDAKMYGMEAETRIQRFVDEMHLAGVADGVGVRAHAAIAKAEATHAE